VKLLPHFGLILGIGLIWYGRSNASDLRIIGYIIVAPSLFALIKKYTSVDVEIPQDEVPTSGYARPSRHAQADQTTEEPTVPSRGPKPPPNGSPRFGSTQAGGKGIIPEPSWRPPVSGRRY